VIDYIRAQSGPIAPAIEGRLQFQNTPPLVEKTGTFKSVADSTISKHEPTYPYGNWAFMYLGHDDLTRAPMKFDLQSILPAYPVDKAILKVYLDAYSGGGSEGSLGAFAITTPWSESTVNWNVPWTTPGGDFEATPAGELQMSKADVGKWLSIDITPLVQKWVMDPATNNGAMLRLWKYTSYTRYRLDSREYWGGQMGPMLEVTYKAP